TNYSYQWVPGTVQMQSMTTSLPVISTAQNGPGTPDATTTIYDSYGRMVQSTDPDGHVTTYTYDTGTGAVTQTVQDAGGLNLVTSYQVDALGRVTQTTDPNGNITYTVYDDANHEVRTYVGWNSTTGLPTGPTQVWREDRPGSYMESLTMSATPHTTGGVPDGTEPISNVQTLSRTYVSAGGQVTDVRDYFNQSGLAYLSTPVLGTEGVNFYDTRYGYDDRGHLGRVQHPTGTIDRTVYDGLGRVVSTWEGTNDTPASDEWSPTNNTGSANMVQLTADVYDNGGV